VVVPRELRNDDDSHDRRERYPLELRHRIHADQVG
jgi:hypothetical protein